MQFEAVNQNNLPIAVVSGGDAVTRDVPSALDLIMTAKYETAAERIAIDKRAISEEFFILSSGMAGEILQKFINYRVQVAIYGDYSRYTTKPLRDFIYGSNCGKDIIFVDTREEAIERLSGGL